MPDTGAVGASFRGTQIGRAKAILFKDLIPAVVTLQSRISHRSGKTHRLARFRGTLRKKTRKTTRRARLDSAFDDRLQTPAFGQTLSDTQRVYQT